MINNILSKNKKTQLTKLEHSSIVDSIKNSVRGFMSAPGFDLKHLKAEGHMAETLRV